MALLLNLSFPTQEEMARASRSIESMLSSSRTNIKQEQQQLRAPFALPSEIPSIIKSDKNHSSISDVDEQLLVREVIYAFQGISSQLVYIDPTTNNFEVDASLNLSTRKIIFY